MEEDKGKRSVTDMQPPKVTHSMSKMQPVRATRSLNEMRTASESRQTRTSRSAQKKMPYYKAAHFAKDAKPAKEPRPKKDRPEREAQPARERLEPHEPDERAAIKARQAEERAAIKAQAAEERAAQKAQAAGQKRAAKEAKLAAKEEAQKLRAEAVQEAAGEIEQPPREKTAKEPRPGKQKPKKISDPPDALPEAGGAMAADADAAEAPHGDEKLKGSFGKARYWIISVVVIAAAVGLVFFVTPRTMPQDEHELLPSATPAPTMEPDPAVENMDPYTLAGLLGEDSEMFRARGEIDDGGGVRIGVTALRDTSRGQAALDGFYTASQNTAVDGLQEVFAYSANSNENRQIQDVYRMINAGANVIVVADASDYNYGRISKIAQENNVKLVAYNAPEGVECAVNVKNSSDPAGWFAESMSGMGFEATYTLSATEEQKAAIEQTLRINASYDDMWDAIYQINLSISEDEPMRSMMVFDYNSNDILRAWLRNDTVPRSVAGRATTAFIKTWYQLLNGGVDVDLPLPADAEEDAEPEVINVEADEEQFSGFAVTDVGNVGDVLFTFAANLARGGVLPEDNFVYEISGYSAITNDNIGEYYERVKDEGAGPVFDASVDTSYINTLFAFPQGVIPVVIGGSAPAAQPSDAATGGTGADGQANDETAVNEQATDGTGGAPVDETQESEPPAA